MSSGPRTLQKNILKARGYMRQAARVAYDATGKPYLKRWRKGEGPILNPNGDPWNGTIKESRHWPK